MKAKHKILILLLTFFFLGSCSFLEQLFFPPVPKSPVIPGPTILPPGESSGVARKLGMNVAAPLDWEADVMLNDAMVSARDWTDLEGNALSEAELDEHYWPTTDAQIIVWHGQANAESGIYTLVFEGQATVSAHWTSAIIGEPNYDPSENTTTLEIEITDPQPSALQLRFIDTLDGISNVRFLRAGRNPDQIFYQEFLDALKDVGTLRFMDFTGTNRNASRYWSDRVYPEYSSHYRGMFGDDDGDGQADYGWQGRGFSWELAIALANAAGKDMWICVPVLADDDYVQNLARLVRDGRTDANGRFWEPLNPDLNLIVELSNELWNTGYAFWQYTYNNREAVNEAASDPEILAIYDPTGDLDLAEAQADDRGVAAWRFGRRRTIKRLIEISQIFRQEFGDAQMISRIRPYLGWQIGNANNVAGEMLDFWDQSLSSIYPGNLRDYIWGGGGTAYYSPDWNSSFSLDSLWTSGNMDAAADWMETLQRDANRAALYGLEYAAYEGGPGFGDTLGSNVEDPRRDILAQAVEENRIIQNMRMHHEVWDRVGGGLLSYFTFGGDYQFGFTEDPAVNTPKLQALEAIAAEQALLPDQAQALPVEARVGDSMDLGRPGWIAGPAEWTDDGVLDLSASQSSGYMAYFFFDDSANSYLLDFYSAMGAQGIALEVRWNGQQVYQRTSTQEENSILTENINISSKRGLNSLQFVFRLEEATSGRCTVQEMSILAD